MSPHSLGRTLIIANPVARSGKGERAALFAMRFFSSFRSTTSSCEVRLTEFAGDAQRMASDAIDYDTVIALGGDGVIHEVVNGLMSIATDQQPRLGIIPMGSGNDFARTLGISMNDPEKAINEILKGEEHAIDLGCVNGIYFMQTLSFGLDAAIALDTTVRQRRNSRQSGSLLFVTSGIKIFTSGVRGWLFRGSLDGEKIEGNDIVFALQNGPTYGGGFRICPDANPTDGKLDLCYSIAKPNLPHSLALFALARSGRHAHSRTLRLRQVRHVEVEFHSNDQPPCQIDGLKLTAPRYVIDVVPKAINVIAPDNHQW